MHLRVYNHVILSSSCVWLYKLINFAINVPLNAKLHIGYCLNITVPFDFFFSLLLPAKEEKSFITYHSFLK